MNEISNEKIVPGGRISGYMNVPGDKSISIRSVLFSAISDGDCNITGLSKGEDIISAMNCISQLGILIRKSGKATIISGKGLHGFDSVKEPIDCGNSGTTLRLLTGLLAGFKNEYTLVGDESLSSRPMARIVDPLRKMGAKIEYLEHEGRIPIKICPAELKGITYKMPVASAQLKSSLLLAGMYARGNTKVIEPSKTRDHTEIMLRAKGVKLNAEGLDVNIEPASSLYAGGIEVPGDISGAAFFIVLAAIMPNSELMIRNVLINETRTGIIDILKEMGADIKLTNTKRICGEESADLIIKSSRLRGVEIKGDTIPKVIDEIPVLAVAAAFAQGTTTIKDAAELRVKESDRITNVCINLKKMGADVEEFEDGMVIRGGKPLNGAIIETFKDHRIAMAFAIAACAAKENSYITESKWADISFPDFFSILNRLREMN